MDRRRIAIVEDDEETRQICLRLLTDAGFACLELDSILATERALATAALGDLVLVDLELGDGKAFALIEQIRSRDPRLPVVALTAHGGDDWVFPALAAGCTGFVLKAEAIRRLRDIVTLALSGEVPLTGSVARRVLERFRAPVVPATSALSPRETEVLRLIAEGRSYQETADQLAVSLDTIRTHVRRIYEKLGVTTKSAATTIAHRRGWLR